MTHWLLLFLLTQVPAEPPPADTLTLVEAVALARAHSPLAAAARAQAEGAAKAAKAAGRLADPVLDLAMENWRPGADDFVASTDLDVFAVIAQPLDLFTRSGRKAQARGESDEAAAGRLRAEQDVVLDTVRRYLETWRSRDLVAALAAQAENLAGIVASMEKRVAEGYAAEADLLRFRAEAARAANHLARARIESERAEAELAFLIGRPAAGVRLEAPVLPPPPGGEPAALAEQAMAHRPDVAAARARAARARGTMSLEHARRYPDVALAGGYKRTGGLDTAVVGVVATVPVFERNGRAVARAEADSRAADLELEATVTRARAEAAILVRAARDLQARLARLDEDLVRPAEEARRSALAAFREGATDVLRVVDAERTNTEARKEALDLTVEAFLTSGRARLAAGLEVLP
jgi:cobalt-zinc-cadmium efflux system outer membrane protein